MPWKCVIQKCPLFSFSERAKQTEAEGERFEESKNINKSLLTLGNVIESKNKRQRVSKLQPILKLL